MALATLAGARDDAQAAALLDPIPDLSVDTAHAARRRVDEWLRGLYDGPDRVEPVAPRPDR